MTAVGNWRRSPRWQQEGVCRMEVRLCGQDYTQRRHPLGSCQESEPQRVSLPGGRLNPVRGGEPPGGCRCGECEELPGDDGHADIDCM